jgi:hypothetical protein
MRNFFASFFGRQAHRPAPRPRLSVEQLNARVLPSAGCMGMTGSDSSSGSSSSAAQIASNFDSGFGGGGFGRFDDFGGFGRHGFFGHHVAQNASLAATLSNSSGATGQAFVNAAGTSLYTVVTGAAANSSLDVSITDNGTTTKVGTVSTNASGNGATKISDVTIKAGDTITVGDLTGTLNQVHFNASLTSGTTTTSTASGRVAYNSVENRLNISVSGATAHTTYEVTVNGTNVGQVTTNGRGRGRLMTSLPIGVSITTGSTIAITDSTGTTTLLSGSFA